jgi:hypothetical protein
MAKAYGYIDVQAHQGKQQGNHENNYSKVGQGLRRESSWILLSSDAGTQQLVKLSIDALP